MGASQGSDEESRKAAHRSYPHELVSKLELADEDPAWLETLQATGLQFDGADAHRVYGAPRRATYNLVVDV